MTSTSSTSETGESPYSGVDTPATSVDEELVKEGANMGAQHNLGQLSENKRTARLHYLVQQSSVYSSIIGKKMEEQQAAMRERAEKEAEKQKQQPEAEEVPTKATKTKAGPTRKSTRSSAIAVAPAAPAKGGKKRGRPAKGKPNSNIADYFKKEDLGSNDKTMSEALADAANDGKDEKLGQQKLRPARQPRLITGGMMKDYQLEGLDWLVSLYENGLNGILADEMGLGKTLQTISFLAFLKEKGVWGPFLIACPVSTLHNWVSEINRFAPEMNVLHYHGTPPARAEMRAHSMKKLDKNFPIVVTSYEMIMIDRKYLQKIPWKYIIIDEGHRIKNLNCKLIRELKSYTSANRLLLTGTPLQNNLAELWSLLNFLLPDIFDDLDSFHEWFDFTAVQDKGAHEEWLAEEQSNNIVRSLHAILKPFLLRRVKVDVEKSLPPKREYILNAPLTQQQKDLYGRLLNKDARGWMAERLEERREAYGGSLSKKRKLVAAMRESEESPKKKVALTLERGQRRKSNKSYVEVDDDEFTEEEFLKHWEANAWTDEKAPEPELDEKEKKWLRTMKSLGSKKLDNLLMQLRLASNSPHIFYPWRDEADPDESIVSESGKMMLLDRLVPELLRRNHKILIFSQFGKMLDIIEDWAVELRGWPVCRIDGGVSQPERQEQIRLFNEEDSDYKIFLLSTRAGGLGINLTASDTVILFDSDFNPQADLQAMDRAHRIGQTKPVLVLRFATQGTVEQSLLDKAEGKRRLEKLIIQNGKFRMKAKSTQHDQDEELSALLLKEDFEKVNVMEKGQQLLTDKELETLLDRSPEAYERAAKGADTGIGAAVRG